MDEVRRACVRLDPGTASAVPRLSVGGLRITFPGVIATCFQHLDQGWNAQPNALFASIGLPSG
jgi:hypothetical protein